MSCKRYVMVKNRSQFELNRLQAKERGDSSDPNLTASAAAAASEEEEAYFSSHEVWSRRVDAHSRGRKALCRLGLGSLTNPELVIPYVQAPHVTHRIACSGQQPRHQEQHPARHDSHRWRPGRIRYVRFMAPDCYILWREKNVMRFRRAQSAGVLR